MDTIKLSREIEKKIKEAKSYLPVICEILKQEGINLTYRIKDKNRILEKVMLFSNRPDFQNMDEIEILNSIGDIIALTVVVDKLEDIVDIGNEIIRQLYEQEHSIKCIKFFNHLSEDSGVTGYQCLLCVFKSQEGMPFEIQFTDKENLIIRESTHEEFEKIKYEKVRELLQEQKEIGER